MRKFIKALVDMKYGKRSILKTFLSNPDNFKYEMTVNDGAIWLKISPKE